MRLEHDYYGARAPFERSLTLSRELGDDRGTTATHVQQILGKLAFSSRAQIATWAVQQGIKPPA